MKRYDNVIRINRLTQGVSVELEEQYYVAKTEKYVKGEWVD